MFWRADDYLVDFTSVGLIPIFARPIPALLPMKVFAARANSSVAVGDGTAAGRNSHRSKTPLAAQIKNLCSEYPRHPLIRG
jgi:hypothetical protein